MQSYSVKVILHLMVSVQSCSSPQHKSVSSPDLQALLMKANAKLSAVCEPTFAKPSAIAFCGAVSLLAKERVWNAINNRTQCNSCFKLSFIKEKHQKTEN